MKTTISQSTQYATPPSVSGRMEKCSGDRPIPGVRLARNWRGTIRLVSSFLPLILLSMLLGASSFQLAVDTPNWTGVPALEHYRAFYQVLNPGTFFQTLLPTALLALLAGLVCNWRPIPATRWRLAGALALMILVGVLTFTFHFPRNKILFGDPLTRPAAYYHRVVTEWVAGDYVRLAMILTAVVLVAVSMIRIARDTAPKELRDADTSGGANPTAHRP
jgi:uncharacterized membrane protein